MTKLYYNSLLITSLLFFWGGVVYRLYQMNYIGVFLMLIFTTITFILLNKGYKVKEAHNLPTGQAGVEHIAHNKPSSLNIILIILYLFFLVTNFVILFQAQSAEALTSPWQVIPWYFFVTYTLSVLVLIVVILNLKSKILNLFLISLHFLLSISVALVVYAIGYGYDPFIHQTTEKLIAQIGAVTPKPFYYLGQYGFVVFIHKLTFIPIVLIDKLLLPILTVLFLPYALFNAIKKFTGENKIALLATLFTLIFPFSIFIATTPQNLAFLFLILIILLSLSRNPIYYSKLDFLIVTLALATASIHPLAGIPAILFVTMNYGKQFIKPKLTTYYLVLLTLLSAITIPVLLYINNLTNPIINSTNSAEKISMWQMPTLFLSGSENFLLNFIYLYKFNIAIIILLFIIAGIFIYKKQASSYLKTNLLMSLALFISFLLTKFINFDYLIDYERSAFANRILLMAIFFTLPFILLTLTKLIESILAQNKIIKHSLLTFLILLIPTSLYTSYPRFDKYENSKSYSVSIYDIKAVNWIEENSVDDNFIVLANQQVTASALREFGFKKYYKTSHGEYFYYPIPTGEKLYQYYLSMVEKSANKKTALEAAELVDANATYLVLNKYWWNFNKVLAEAKYEADEIKNIDNQVYIFKYIK